jgi:hypothetical protein
MQRLLRTKHPGDELRITIYRRGSGHSVVTLKLATIPKASDLPTDSDLM